MKTKILLSLVSGLALMGFAPSPTPQSLADLASVLKEENIPSDSGLYSNQTINVTFQKKGDLGSFVETSWKKALNDSVVGQTFAEQVSNANSMWLKVGPMNCSLVVSNLIRLASPSGVRKKVEALLLGPDKILLTGCAAGFSEGDDDQAEFFILYDSSGDLFAVQILGTT